MRNVTHRDWRIFRLLRSHNCVHCRLCAFFSVELLCPLLKYVLITRFVFSRAVVSLFFGSHKSNIRHQAVFIVDMYSYCQIGHVKTALWLENIDGSLEVRVAVIMQLAAFRDVTWCSLIKKYQHIGEACCLHLQAFRPDGGSRRYLFTELRVHEVNSKKQVMFIKIRITEMT